MRDLKQFTDLKTKVEQAQQRADRAQGSLDQLMQQLKKEFDCDNIEEAEKKLRGLEKEEKTTTEEYETAFQAFEEKWQDKLL